MQRTTRLLVVMLCLGAAFAAGRWTHAQAPTGPQLLPLAQVVPPPLRGQPQGPTVLSGGDIGFRVDRQNGDVPIGRLVVRVNGQWVEPQFAPGVTRLSP